MKIRRADSVPECGAMNDSILKGNHEGNFFEGMGCKGGCVGGPKALVNREEGKKNVQAYSDEAQYKTPAENPYVIELLKKLGFAYEGIEHKAMRHAERGPTDLVCYYLEK